MVPCDVTAFMKEFVSLRDGLSKVLLCAWLKEPTAVHAFARESNGLGGTAGPRAVFRTLQWALRFTAERWPCNKAELQQISRQGVARFVGVRAACLSLEVIAPQTPEDIRLGVMGGEKLTLGLTKRASPVCLAQTCPLRFREFVEACNRQHADFATLMRDTPVTAEGFCSLSERLGELLRIIDHECGLGWGEQYVRPNLLRKVMCAWLRDGLGATAGPTSFQWAALPYAFLDSVHAVADVKENVKPLSALTPDMSAAEVSEFVLGRRDHALFVSMWACLFGEVEQAHPSSEERNRILKLLKSPEAAAKVAAFQNEHGVPPCPFVLVRALLYLAP